AGARCAGAGGGGGPGRNWLAEESTKSFHRTSSTPPGLLPVQIPGPTGTDPSHFFPSSLRYSITRAATARPRSSPAFVSLGYTTPAITRLFAASSAASAKRFASPG